MAELVIREDLADRFKTYSEADQHRIHERMSLSSITLKPAQPPQ